MTNPTNCGPAFPMADLEKCADGLSKREWFAGMAIMAAWSSRSVGEYEGDTSDIAACAFQLADFMLRESQKGGA